MAAKLVRFARSVFAHPVTLVTGLALVSLLWAFWPTLAGLRDKWSRDPQYSHGYLVPLFALFLLWSRRGHIQGAVLAWSWWGVPLLLAGVGLRLAGAYYYFPWLEALALLPCLAGIGLLAGGRPVFAWTWPAVGFLAFMLPLPYRVETALAGPLRHLATAGSTYLLQLFGLPAVAQGNTILLNEVSIGVVEACSGLSMLLVFFALAAAVALLVKRAWWEKAALIVSAVPIALAANIARITLTGMLHELVGGEEADVFFHDGAGWFMMPFALALLGAELFLFSWLFPPFAGRRSSPLPLGSLAGWAGAPVKEAGKPKDRQGKSRRKPSQPKVPLPPRG